MKISFYVYYKLAFVALGAGKEKSSHFKYPKFGWSISGRISDAIITQLAVTKETNSTWDPVEAVLLDLSEISVVAS